MNRRIFLRQMGQAIAAGIGLSAGVVVGQSSPIEAARLKELREALEYGLKARLPREFAFIRHVVQLVAEEKLTTKLVLAALNWARDKQPYPFPYFVRAVTILAARRGIRIGPVYDDSTRSA